MNASQKFLLAIKPQKMAAVIGLSFAIVGTTSSEATPILGGKIFVQNTGDVVATFQESYAGVNNLLLLASAPNNLGVIFEVNVTPAGTTVNLGTFTAGTELIFELNNQHGGIFFNGPASRNPDNVIHAFVDYQYAPGQTFVGFEDIFGGGDRDYNDLQFTLSDVTSVPTSVPDRGATSAMLLGTAVLFLALLRRSAHR